MTNILKTPALKEGDTIGVVAPAYPFPIDSNSDYYNQYLTGKSELESLGFKVTKADNLGQIDWWSGGTPQQRAEDINNFFANPNVKAIIANDGGNDCIL